MEASNLSDRDLRVMVIRILNSKRHRNHKRGPVRNKNVISEINSILEEINSKLDEADNWISDFLRKIFYLF